MFELLFLIGVIAFIGFGCRWAFERTRVPEVLILLAVGFALGPLGLLSHFTLLDINLDSFRGVAPFIGAVAIVSLVFEAGLRLKIEQVSKRISFSTVFALSNFVACVSVLTLILHFGFNWNLSSSLLLGAILGAPSSLAVYAMLPFVRTSNQARGILYFEATLSTLLACALAISVLRYANTDMAGAGLFSALKMLFSSFSISLILGLAVGVAILWALFKFKIKKFGYLLTLSALFMLYFVDFELLGGIGVISIAVIGLIIGNSGSVFKLLRVSEQFDLGESSKGFQEEISLFVSTFFFVYLGMVVRPNYLVSLDDVAVAVALVAGILVARCVILWLSKKLGRSLHNENLLLNVMIPRNLLSATLATLVLMYPGPASFSLEIVVLAIILSALVTSFGVSYYEWKFKDSFLFKRELTLKDGRKVVLRTITRDDFPKMRQFLNALVREGALIARDRYLNPIEEKELERESLDKINRGDALVWVCEYDKHIIARAVAKRMDLRERDNVDLSLYVAKDFRGVGLGTKLLRMLIKEAQNSFKPHKIYLSAYSNNLKAIRIYEKEGFEKIGVLPEWGKYQDTYLDEIYLEYKPKKTRSARSAAKR